MNRFDHDDIDFDFFAEPETVEVVRAGGWSPRLQRSRGRGSGGGSRRPPASPPPGLVPLARLAGLVAIAIVAVVVLVFWIGACQGAGKHDEYAGYLSNVRVLAQSSSQVGAEFANKLLSPGLKTSDLETSLQGYAEQEQQAYFTAASISFPASGSIPPPQFRSHIEAHRRFGASRRRAEKRRWARPSRRLIGRRS